MVYSTGDDDQVRCYTDHQCIRSDTLSLMTKEECCRNNPEGLAFATIDDDTCYTCIGTYWYVYRLIIPFKLQTILEIKNNMQ